MPTLAMMPRPVDFCRLAAVLLCVGASAGQTARAFTWDDLWSRPDQRAEKLLESGKPAAAAPLFADPQHRGYAEIEAHDYAAAAKRLASLSDPESAYNRGNALARANQLNEALEAYDAALKQAPTDSRLHKDAQHNRDLVAQQLKSQGGDPQHQNRAGNKDSGKSGDGQNGSGQNSQGQNGQGQNPPKDAANQSPPKDANNPGSQSKDQQDRSQSGKDAPGTQSQSGQGQQAQNQDAAHAGQNGQNGQTPQDASQSRPNGQSPQNGSAGAAGEPPKDSAAKAEADARVAADLQRDAERRAAANAAAGKTGHPPGAADATSALQAGATDAKPKPETEQAMALDQWLRWIPDDPAGLLRRKFMIEHMEKQRSDTP